MGNTSARWDATSRCKAAAMLWMGLLLATRSAVPAISNDELFAEADDRIERARKSNCELVLTEPDGATVAGEVVIEQTRQAFLFGSNIFKWGKIPDPEMEAAYRERFSELFNYATLGFYWNSYERRQGSPSHDYATQVARWCRSRDIAVKGHPLAWNHADPAWLPKDPESIRRLQMQRIEDCVSRFAGLIDRWDVVNEATHFDREEMARVRAPKMTAMWKQTGQMEFTRECFARARQAGPQATLLINDYRTDPAYERVAERLASRAGKPLYDVIGIQSHMHAKTWPNTRIWEVCERFSRFGVPLHFTEMTILSGQQGWRASRDKAWPSTTEGEARQAREVARVYTMLFSHPAVEAVTWWDFSDLRAWKSAPAGLVRADMTPKPACLELKKLIHDKWRTRTNGKSGKDGSFAFRGFHGTYRVTVSAGEKKQAEEFSLRKGDKNRWVVVLK